MTVDGWQNRAPAISPRPYSFKIVQDSKCEWNGPIKATRSIGERCCIIPVKKKDHRQHVCRNCTPVNILLSGPDVRDIVITGVFGIDSDEMRRFLEAGQRNERHRWWTRARWPGWRVAGRLSGRTRWAMLARSDWLYHKLHMGRSVHWSCRLFSAPLNSICQARVSFLLDSPTSKKRCGFHRSDVVSINGNFLRFSTTSLILRIKNMIQRLNAQLWRFNLGMCIHNNL